MECREFSRCAVRLILIFGFLSVWYVISFSQLQWVTGYYPNWYYAILRPGVRWNGDNSGATGQSEKSMIDFSKLTHIVVFTGWGTSDKYPYCCYVTNELGPFGKSYAQEIEFGASTGQPAPYLQALVQNAHAHGVKVAISMGGIFGGGARQMSMIAADPEKTEAFVHACCTYAKEKGADGVEINWEFPRQSDQVGFLRLIQSFRRRLNEWDPRGIFIATAYARTDERMVDGALVDGQVFGYVRDSMLAAFDQINIETYTMWQGDDQDYRTGFNTPIDLPTQFEGYNGYSLNDKKRGDGMGSVGTWIAAGYPTSRLGMSLSPNTTEFTGATTMGQKYQSFKFGSYANVPASHRYWDSTAQSPWYTDGVGKVITFEDTTSIRLKVDWAKRKGFGGLMLYDLGSMYLPDAPEKYKDQLLRAAWRAARGETK
ncbi:MAG TPA: glycoside hydrolase family 18 protein [Bacteroidota bacterium]|nr:glycoside hydrolase family 18 protein [Bacteroidota bacterium]